LKLEKRKHVCNAGMVRQVTAAEGEDLVLPALRLVWRIGGI
jgi:hypothetical protein